MILIYQNIGWLDIQVSRAQLVHVIQCFQDLLDVRRYLILAEMALA